MVYLFKASKLAIGVAATLVLILAGLLACQAAPSPSTPPAGKLSVAPASVELAFPGVLKVPIKFTAAGFGPKEIVTADMALPEGVEVNGVSPGEPVALGFAQTDESGNATIPVETMTVVLTLLRGELTGTGVPVATSLRNPLPAGTYNVVASGANSGTTAACTITFTHPAKKS